MALNGDVTVASGKKIEMVGDGIIGIVDSDHDADGNSLTISGGSTTDGTTNDKVGGDLILQGGAGKGTGVGGSIIFQSATAGNSGSSLNIIDDTILTLASDLSATFAGNVNATAGLDVTGNLTITTGNVEVGGDLIMSDGGTVSQNTSKSTAVTLNKRSGKITMNNATLNSDTTVSFIVNNNTVKTGDVIIVNHISGGTFGDYIVQAGETVANTSFKISVRNVSGGDLSNTLVLHFVIITATIS